MDLIFKNYAAFSVLGIDGSMYCGIPGIPVQSRAFCKPERVCVWTVESRKHIL